MIGKTHANTKVMHINIAESDEESWMITVMNGMKWSLQMQGEQEARCKKEIAKKKTNINNTN